MLFYVQQININSNTGIHDVILDVSEMSEYQHLYSALDTIPERNLNNDDQPSMLQFSYRPCHRRFLREGSWYEINPEKFKQAEIIQVTREMEGSLYLHAILLNVTETNLEQSLKKQKIAILDYSVSYEDQFYTPADALYPIKLTVVSCGHGNWNEISTDSIRLIYDIGAGRSYKLTDMRTLINRRHICCERKRIVVIISHWDIDHYHALLAFRGYELDKISAIIIPSQIPNTQTFRKVQNILAAHNVPLVPMSPAKSPSGSKKISLELQSTLGIFKIFRATVGASRNQTGIVLGIQGTKKIALLTGDHHYEKILDAVKKIYAYKGMPCVLVTPHHGGRAGNASPADWLNFFTKIETPISCGQNSYGHPSPAVLNKLTVMQGGKSSPHSTFSGGTWITDL